MRALSKIRTFLSLNATERWLILQAFGMVPLTALGLRLFGFKRWYAALNRLAGTAGKKIPPEHEVRYVQRLMRLMRLVMRNCPYKGNCLSRSLTFWWLLHRQGIASDLRIGVRQENGFQAHAWVEYQGYPLNDSAKVHQDYAAFDASISPDNLQSFRPSDHASE